MKLQEIKVSIKKTAIIFVGYATLLFSCLMIWSESIVEHEFSIVFPILYTLFSLGVTTPIIIKIIFKQFKIVINEDGFVNQTGLFKSPFVSWKDVDSITFINGTVGINLINHDSYLASSSYMTRLLAKINSTTLTLVTWYLELPTAVVHLILHEYAYHYQYSHTDLTPSEEITILGAYDTPYLDMVVTMVEFSAKISDLSAFTKGLYALSPYSIYKKLILTKIVCLNNEGTRVLEDNEIVEEKRLIAFFTEIKEGDVIMSPMGNFLLPAVQILPERLEEIVDFGHYFDEFRLYKDARALTKSELDGTGYIEFSRHKRQGAGRYINWSDDSIYYDLESIGIILYFLPEDMQLDIYGYYEFSKNESMSLIKNMMDYINDPESARIFFDKKMSMSNPHLDDNHLYYKHIQGFLTRPEILIPMLEEFVEFVDSANGEIVFLGI